MLNDLRYAFRMLVKNPGFTLVAVLSLAIGIGASTAIFSLVNAIILRALPVPNPGELRLIQWSGTDPKIDGNMGALRRGTAKHAVGDAFSYPQYRALRDESSELAEIGAHVGLPDVTVRARREAFVAMGSMVSGNFFPVLGVRPRLGRLLAAEDDRIGAPAVAVISYRSWEREYGLDPAVLGQSILLNGTGYTIIGVLPQEFS